MSGGKGVRWPRKWGLRGPRRGAATGSWRRALPGVLAGALLPVAAESQWVWGAFWPLAPALRTRPTDTGASPTSRFFPGPWLGHRFPSPVSKAAQDPGVWPPPSSRWGPGRRCLPSASPAAAWSLTAEWTRGEWTWLHTGQWRQRKFGGRQCRGAGVRLTPRPQESWGARTGRSLGKEGLSLQLRNPGLRWEDSDLDLPAGFQTRGEEKE